MTLPKTNANAFHGVEQPERKPSASPWKYRIDSRDANGRLVRNSFAQTSRVACNSFLAQVASLEGEPSRTTITEIATESVLVDSNAHYKIAGIFA